MTQQRFYATGKRKSAIARVYMKAGSGNIVVNKRNYEEYFDRPSLKMVIKQPFEITGKTDQFDLYINVNGGGVAGQAGAVKHGISKALLEYDAELRSILKKAGFLTRDARIKERNTGNPEQGKDSNSPSVKFINRGGFRPPFFL